MVIAIVPAAGTSSRMGTTISKIFLEVKGRSILSYTVESLVLSKSVNHIIVVGRSTELETAKREAIVWKNLCGLSFIEGGNSRQESVGFGVEKAVELGAKLIAIHDGARPLCQPNKIALVIKRAKESDVAGAILAISTTAVIKNLQDPEFVNNTINLQHAYLSQSPQVFKAEILQKAYQTNYQASDDSELVEKIGGKIAVIAGSETNIKIETTEDLFLFEALLELRSKKNEIEYSTNKVKEVVFVRR